MHVIILISEPRNRSKEQPKTEKQRLSTYEVLRLRAYFQPSYLAESPFWKLARLFGVHRNADLFLSEEGFYGVHPSIKDYIVKLYKEGYRPQVKLAPQEIPNGYIGLVRAWNGAKLKSQKYLKTQEGRAEKIVFEPLWTYNQHDS